MAKSHYSFKKRKKELERKEKQEKKRQRRQEKGKILDEENPDEPLDDSQGLQQLGNE